MDPLQRSASRHRGIGPIRLIGAAGQPAFGAGWASVAGFPLGFRIDDYGIVHLSGRAQNTSGNGNTVVTVLPPEASPPEYVDLFAATGAGSVMLDVYPSGGMIVAATLFWIADGRFRAS